MAKAADKKKATSKKSKSNILISDKLFAGMRVGLWGKFENHPKREELIEFLKFEGAQVESEVSGDLDMVVLGQDDVDAGKRKVRELNKKGASIRLVESPRDLSMFTPEQHAAMVRDPAALRRLEQIANPKRFWIMRFDRLVENERFHKLALAGDPAEKLDLGQFAFCGCTFESSTLSDIKIGGGDKSFAKSKLIDCKLTRVTILHPRQSEFRELQADDLEIGAARVCSFSHVSTTNATLRSIRRCQFEDCKFSMSREKDIGAELEESTLATTEIDLGTLQHFTAQRCTLSDVTFRKGSLTSITFRNCKLSNVRFNGVAAKELVFISCRLSKCQFNHCSGDLLSLDDASTATKCSADGVRVVTINLSEKALKGVTGLSAPRMILDVTTFANLMQLAELILESKKLNFEIEAVDESGVARTLKLERMYWHASHLSFMDKEQRDPLWLRHAYNTKPEDVARLLLRLLTEAKVRTLDERSLKTQTSKCALKPKALKQLVFAALSEGLQPAASGK